jgi:nucleotide-binding universal stress UspA family protein
MIIMCYDGSADAQAAAARVNQLFHEKPATVLTVWEPYTATLESAGGGLGSGFGLSYDMNDVAGIDAQLLEQARRTAEEGAQRLRAADMGADSLVEERDGSIARTVLAVAKRVNAEAVVVGTRGRGEAKSTLLGSVSHALVQHADRAVVVVPSAALARHRQDWLPHVL